MTEPTSNKRRRGANLENELLEATRRELKDVGYRKLSLDSVALRAGTSKAVLYRRWANRVELVVAALRDSEPQYTQPGVDTGSLRSDVLSFFGSINEGPSVVPMDIGLGILTDTLHNPKLHEYFLARIRLTSTSLMVPILNRAEGRGEIATSALPERIITLPVDLARHEIVLTGRQPSRAAIVQIVDDIYIPLLQTFS